MSPIISLFSGIAPVSAHCQEVFLNLVPFLVTLELAIKIGTWGIAGYDAKAGNLSFFPLGLKAIRTVAQGGKISFEVMPKVHQSGNFLTPLRPQIAVVALTLIDAVWATGARLIRGTAHSAASVIAPIL